MEYEKPAVTVLAIAIDAIQSLKAGCGIEGGSKDASAAYEDWE